MKLLAFIIILLGTIVAFLYLCQKLGFDVISFLNALGGGGNRGNNIQVQAAVPDQSVKRCVLAEYEAFSSLVWKCLNSVYRICSIECPDSLDRIWCARTADRVKIIDGHWSFLYEVPLVNTCAIRNGQISSKPVDVQRIVEALSENLPDYMDGGFSYTGKVFVWPIDQDRVRIEIQGVCRNYCNNVGEIII